MRLEWDSSEEKTLWDFNSASVERSVRRNVSYGKEKGEGSGKGGVEIIVDTSIIAIVKIACI